MKLLGSGFGRKAVMASTSALPSSFPASPSFRASEFRASEFQSKDQMLQWLEEVLGGARALKAERAKKPKPAKTASERHRGEGNSAWS